MFEGDSTQDAPRPPVPKALAVGGWAIFADSLHSELWPMDRHGWIRCVDGGRIWPPGEAEERLAVTDPNRARRFVYRECRQQGVVLSGTRYTHDTHDGSVHQGEVRVARRESYVCEFLVTSRTTPAEPFGMALSGHFCGYSVAQLQRERDALGVNLLPEAQRYTL